MVTELRRIIGPMHAYDLCALNTWCSPKQYNMHTFRMQDKQTQIDYVFTRRLHADFRARMARPVWDMDAIDHSPWRGGAKHMAIRGSLPLFPGWRSSPNPTGDCPGYDKHALDNAVRQNTSEAQLLRDAVQRHLDQQEAITVKSINTALLGSCQQVFPWNPKHRASRRWQTEEVRSSVLDLWQARRVFQSFTALMRRQFCGGATSALQAVTNSNHCCLRTVFDCMKAHTRLQKVYKELQRRGRQKRRQFLEEQLAKAKLAAVRHDTKELYAVVRRLAPKQRRRNVRIRKPDGMPLCAEAEYDEILEYFTGLFSQQGFGFTASEPVAISSDRITITSSEVCSALNANKIGKAVPVQHAPASAWIACTGIPTLTEAVADEATGYWLYKQ